MSSRPRQAAGREFGRFFLPGPTEVRPEVLRAMGRPVMGHRGREMVGLIEGVQPGLKSLFGTERPVYVSTSSATGLMEAAVTNLSRRRVLCLVGGAFGKRFRDIAAAVGKPADTLEVEWGGVHRGEALRERLSEDPARYDLVTVVHSETSTGVLDPVAELAEAVREFPGVLLAVDGVSSVGGVEVRMDDWGVDFFLTGSQKALALPPGLAFGAASERAVARAEEVSDRGYYFDLLDFERRVREAQTPNTPAVPILYALEHQMRAVEEEGVEARWERHARMARATHRWVEESVSRSGPELELLAPEGHRSPTVTAVRLPPDGPSGPEVARRVRERGWSVAPGYGKLKEETFRVGHMGDHTDGELEGLLAALEEALS